MSYEIELTPIAIYDIQKHKQSGNKAVLIKLNQLFSELREQPTFGTGKPEQLKHSLQGLWSRRINREHRLVYEINGKIVSVLSTKGHYI